MCCADSTTIKLKLQTVKNQNYNNMETIKIYKLQFYADNDQYKNKLFSFGIKNRIEIFNILFAFWKNKNEFRSIWLKKTEIIGTYQLDSSKELIYEYNFFKLETDIMTAEKSTVLAKYISNMV
jgi:hypothetical protein